MAVPPYGTKEYGAAQPGYTYVPINASLNHNPYDPNFNDCWHEAELSDQFNPCSQVQLGIIEDIFGALEPLGNATPPNLNDILSNGKSSAASACINVQESTVQESTVFNMRPQVYERSPSLTFFVDPPPPPSKVVQLQVLPPGPPAVDDTAHMPRHGRYNRLHPWQFHFNAEELHSSDRLAPKGRLMAFHPDCIDHGPSADEFWTQVRKVSAAPVEEYMPLAPAMDIINNQDAHALHITDAHNPNLVSSPCSNFTDQNHVHMSYSGGAVSTNFEAMAFFSASVVANSTSVSYLPHSAPTISNICPGSNVPASPTYMHNMRYMNGAVSDSAALEWSSTSSPTSTSLSYHQASIPGFPHQGISLSAPVSPSPSGNVVEAFHNQSFSYGVEDMGSVHGGSRTDLYKKHDKNAWKKPGSAEGSIKKKKQSRTAKLAVPHSFTAPGGDNGTHENTNHEESNLSYDGHGEIVIRVKTDKLNLHDGYVWRKYGEKEIKGEKHRRSYLKCEERKRSGCGVTKRTQRCSHDDDYVDFIYVGRHSHHP